MACLFCDLDGVAFVWGSNTFVSGACERLKSFYDAGGQIVFTTQRESWMDGFKPLEETKKMLQGLFPKCEFLSGISSPRIVINDAGAIAINHVKDAPWMYDFNAMAD